MSDHDANPDLLCMRCTRGNLNTHKPGYIPARILWPALGFPAVIAPGSPSKLQDATTSVSVVILTKRSRLTKKHVFDHLRFVPWEKRRTRYLPPGPANGFTEDEIEVRSTGTDPIDEPGIVGMLGDDFVMQLYFGYDQKRGTPGKSRWDLLNGFPAGVSRFVLKKYSEWDYHYLHEIRISRSGSSRLAAGKYNLFWINNSPKDTENDISDEMDLLIKRYATPTREPLEDTLTVRTDDNSKLVKEIQSYLLKEYEYDYDALHQPYTSVQVTDPKRRTEVLHPLFVQQALDQVRFGHITDLHVDVRSDVYEYNLKQGWPPDDGDDDEKPVEVDLKTVEFNNWNKSCNALYNRAKQSCDALLLTGDLIDYGRGHWGIQSGRLLGDDTAYQVDRNWFLFYYLLASGDSYQKPVYTILGNHDWRINPYTPFAVAGAPEPAALINNYQRYTQQQLRKIIATAHGPGYHKAFSYAIKATDTLDLLKQEPEEFYRTLWKLLTNTKSMNIPNAPTETRVESIAWYLLVINPFLDYTFQLPGGFDVTMLDWAEAEDVLFPIVVDGEEWPYLPTEAKAAAGAGPKAAKCLTEFQKYLVEELVARPGAAKVVCVHAPPIGPYPAWTDDFLYAGRIEHPEPRQAPFQHEEDKLPGSTQYKTIYKDGTSRTWWGHYLFAVRPKNGLFGQEADYGSFQQHREWFINELRNDNARVRLVLSGHIHRNGLFVVYTPQDQTERSIIAGQLLTRRVIPQAVNGVSPPAVSLTPEGDHPPLYVNTICAGPRGHWYQAKRHEFYVDPGYAEIDLSSNGTIEKIEFLTAKSAVSPAPVVSATGRTVTRSSPKRVARLA